MSHFAKVEDGIVTNVIVAEQDFIDSGAVGDPSLWVQTSRNTYGGIHYGPDGLPDGGIQLRKNYAGIGYTYDVNLDAFIPCNFHNGWTLNKETCLWEPPIPYPDPEKLYIWDNENLTWVEEVEG